MITLKRENLLCFTVFVLLLASNTLLGQRFQFSQYNMTPIRVNPAIVAASDFADLNIIYRNQSTAGDFSINSSSASYHRPYFFRRSKLRWAGIGLSVMDDRAGGSALLSDQSMTLTGGINIHTARNQSLSFGASAILHSRSYSLDGLTTGSQYVPGRGIVPTKDINEDFDDLSLTSFRFNAGIRWQEIDRFLQPTKYIGISFADINRPDQALLINDMFKIPASTIVEAGFQLFNKTNLSATTEILYTGSGGTHALNVGMVWRLKMNEDRRSRDFTRLAIHTKYVVESYGILAVQWEQPKFTFGVSYDISIGAIRAANAGALEISLVYKNLMTPKKKRRRTEKESDGREKVKKKRKTKNRKSKKRKKKKGRKKKQRPDRVRKEKETNEVPEVIEEKPTVNEEVEIGKEKKDLAKEKVAETKEKEKIEEPAVDVLKDSLNVEKEMEPIITNRDAQAGKLIYRSSELEKGSIAYEFEFNKVEPTESFKQYLDGLALLLKQDEFLSIEIVGHTDATGPEEYNQRLSEQRAEAVFNYLQTKGISRDRMQTIGKGETEPVSATSSNHENRRVEIWLSIEK